MHHSILSVSDYSALENPIGIETVVGIGIALTGFDYSALENPIGIETGDMPLALVDSLARITAH